MLGIDLRMAHAVWMRNVTVYRRTWVLNILPNFFEPLLFLVGMGIGLGAYLEQGMRGPAYVAFLGPGLMAAAAMNGASFETTYNMFVRMNFARIYDAYLGTPAAVQDIAFGELCWAVTRALIYGVAFLLVLVGLTLAGYPVLTSPWAASLPFAIALTGLSFALIGQAFTSVIRAIDLYGYYFTLFLTPLFLFSGIFFPVDRFPYGEIAAWCTPLYHAVRMMRDLSQGPVGMRTVVSIVWLIALSAALFPFVVRRMRGRMVH